MTDDKNWYYDPVLITAFRQEMQMGLKEDPWGYLARGSKDVGLNVANNLVEKIAFLLTGKVTRSTVVNSRGEVKHRIIIEYD